MFLEIVALALTIAFGVWFFLALSDRRTTAELTAGPLVLRLRPTVSWWFIVGAAFGGAACAWLLLLAFVLGGDLLGQAIVWIAILQFQAPYAIASACRAWHDGLELREKGIVRRVNGTVMFTAWSEIRYCTWLPWNQSLFVQQRFQSTEVKIRREMAPIALETLGRFVHVRAARMLPADAGPSEDEMREATTERPKPAIVDRQFSLRTLLILVVYLSSFFGWVGIKVQQWRVESDALAAIARFQPQYERKGIRVRSLSFARSTREPRDADLPLLARFSRLASLDLSGSPVTDRGIVPLKRMISLWSIDLRGTLVTEQGFRDLQESLPRTTIFWTPPPPPPATPAPPPSPWTPPAGK